MARVPGVQNVIGTSNDTIFQGGLQENCTKVHTKSEQQKRAHCGRNQNSSCSQLVLLRQAVVSSRLRDGSGFRQCFDQIVEEGLALVKRLDGNAFIAAVESDVIAIEENALDSIRWNTGDAKGLPIGRSHHHDGHYRPTWPKSFC